MSFKILKEARKLPIKGSPKAVLFVMAEIADDDGYTQGFASIPRLALETGLSRRSVVDAIKALELMGVVESDRSNGRQSTYQVTPDNYKSTVIVLSERTKKRKSTVSEPVQMPQQPVQMPHQCNSRTGANAATTSANAAFEPVQMPQQPVQMPQKPVRQPHSINHINHINQEHQPCVVEFVPNLEQLNHMLKTAGEKPITQEKLDQTLVTFKPHYESMHLSNNQLMGKLVSWIKRDFQNHKTRSSKTDLACNSAWDNYQATPIAHDDEPVDLEGMAF